MFSLKQADIIQKGIKRCTILIVHLNKMHRLKYYITIVLVSVIDFYVRGCSSIYNITTVIKELAFNTYNDFT